MKSAVSLTEKMSEVQLYARKNYATLEINTKGKLSL